MTIYIKNIIKYKMIATSVHGNDFASCGPKLFLDWMKNAIAVHYKIRMGPRMGPEHYDARDWRVLKRIIGWLDDSIKYEYDFQQTNKFISQWGFKSTTSGVIPIVRATFKEYQKCNGELPKHLIAVFRPVAALGKHVAADRLDAQFACM